MAVMKLVDDGDRHIRYMCGKEEGTENGFPITRLLKQSEINYTRSQNNEPLIELWRVP